MQYNVNYRIDKFSAKLIDDIFSTGLQCWFSSFLVIFLVCKSYQQLD